MTLSELASIYGTDKLDHGYIPFYEKYLPKNPKRLLEIGVNEGRSIQMWQKYFPDCEIHGLDLFIEINKPDIPGAIFHKGDQRDWEILEQLRKFDFDVIIDDGSHNSRDQMMTFFGLFNGKPYFIEDLHCCWEPLYQDGLPDGATAYSLFGNDFLQGLETIRDNKIVLIKC